jgi:5-(carboxyamino)imidazole ribonucleotide mutase
MRINVLFGSESDKGIFEPLCDRLRAIDGVDVFFEVCSAHRDPERLRKIINEKPCDLYITGAGLAAHLPGVVASQTITPVIGIPCNDILLGLDALLSIIQMPKGVPALAAGVSAVDHVVSFVAWYAGNMAKPPILKVNAPAWATKQVEQLKKPLAEIGWQFACGNNASNVLELELVDLQAGKAPIAKTTFLGAPIIEKTPFEGDPRNISEITSKGGLWLGINNITNLQIALLELWQISSKEQGLLKELKGGVKQSVR